MSINWRPIADLPDELKDGREMLLWETAVEGRAEIAAFDTVWCDRDGATIHGITHFAEIDPRRNSPP
jgi:hypothetical protein